LTLAVKELRQPLSTMLALVEGGAHLDYRNTASLTPMHKAAITGHREPIQVCDVTPCEMNTWSRSLRLRQTTLYCCLRVVVIALANKH